MSRLAEIVSEVLSEVLSNVASLEPQPQRDEAHSHESCDARRFESTGRFILRDRATRARFSALANAYTSLNSRRLIIWSAYPEDEKQSQAPVKCCELTATPDHRLRHGRRCISDCNRTAGAAVGGDFIHGFRKPDVHLDLSRARIFSAPGFQSPRILSIKGRNAARRPSFDLQCCRSV